MKGSAYIINGELRYSKDILDFIVANEDEEVEVDLVVINKPEHFLYKYYFGYLLEDMLNHISGSYKGQNSRREKERLHEQMKEMFAVENVISWEEVPKRHRYRCQRFEMMDRTGEIKRTYIKSLSSMTHEEMKKYIMDVEQHYYVFLSGGSNQDKAKSRAGYELRVKGMMDAKQLRKKLRSEHGTF